MRKTTKNEEMNIKIYDTIEKKEIGVWPIPLLAGYLMGCHQRGEDIGRYTYSIDTDRITRVEVIELNEGGGRKYVNWKKENKVELSLQDDGRTMKIFISEEK